MNSFNTRHARIAMFVMLAIILIAIVAFMPPVAKVAQAQDTSTPTPTLTLTPTLTPTPTLINTPFALFSSGGLSQYFVCRADTHTAQAADCIQIHNGADMHAYASTGLLTFSLDAETGNIVSTGSLTVQNVVASTPVVRCTTQTVGTSGVATLVPFYATPLAPVVSIGQVLTADGNKVDAVNSAGVVTIHTWNNAAIPTAATTPVVVNICVAKG